MDFTCNLLTQMEANCVFSWTVSRSVHHWNISTTTERIIMTFMVPTWWILSPCELILDVSQPDTETWHKMFMVPWGWTSNFSSLIFMYFVIVVDLCLHYQIKLFIHLQASAVYVGSVYRTKYHKCASLPTVSTLFPSACSLADLISRLWRPPWHWLCLMMGAWEV